jgi:hypothetical protein
MEKEIEKYKKVLQYYLDSVINPKIENFEVILKNRLKLVFIECIIVKITLID